jgi:L-iditol 2-dehydrogenase
VRLTNISLNDTILVGGAGIIGLFLIQLLRQSGCGNIIAFDLNEERLTLARQLGATHVMNASTANVAEVVRSLTDGRGADVGFDVVGVPAVLTCLVESVRKGASITLIGNVSAEVPLPLQKVVTRQLKLQGSCAICGEYDAVLDLLERGALSVDPMMSAVAPLDEGAEWFDRLYRQEKGLLKVILKP